MASQMSGSDRGKYSNDQESSAMSSKAKPYIVGAALGASAMFFALQYHVVHSHDGFQIIPRTPQQSLGLAYTDIRSWSPSQWTDRPELARALMAHGSSDLIADSVASTLADQVSEDSHGLDELRSFLNETRTKVEEGADDLLTIPRSDDSADASSSKKSKASKSSDVVGIPFPRDAKSEPPANPFRPRNADDEEPTVPGTMAESGGPSTDVASRAETPIQSKSSPKKGSRFSADDVIDGFEDFDSPTSPRSSGTSEKSSTSSKTSSVLEQGRKAADRLFGDENSSSTIGTAGASSGKGASSSKPVKKPVEPQGESESMFEEVTSQLENRAQDALNRAQEAARTRVSSAAESATKSGTSFVRERAEQVLPEAAKELLKATSGEAGPSAMETFDPFLE